MICNAITWMTQIMLLAGCSTQPGAIRGGADFTGFIMDIQMEAASDNGIITAESHAAKLVHRCQITVDARTKLYRWNGMGIVPIVIQDIRLKDKIKIWFVSPAPKEYPPEGRAKKIIVSTSLSLDDIR